MKNGTKLAFGLGLLLVALVALAEDHERKTIRYRNNTVLSMDSTVILKDEDGGWTNGPAQFLALSQLNLNNATNANSIGQLNGRGTNTTIVSGTISGNGAGMTNINSTNSITGRWNLTNTFGILSNSALPFLIQSGRATNVNETTVTNTFSTAYSAAPVVTVAAGTNDLPHLVSVTTTNVIFGAATTNAIIRWIAIGTP